MVCVCGCGGFEALIPHLTLEDPGLMLLAAVPPVALLLGQNKDIQGPANRRDRDTSFIHVHSARSSCWDVWMFTALAFNRPFQSYRSPVLSWVEVTL